MMLALLPESMLSDKLYLMVHGVFSTINIVR